jgi:hypothetical protein
MAREGRSKPTVGQPRTKASPNNCIGSDRAAHQWQRPKTFNAPTGRSASDRVRAEASTKSRIAPTTQYFFPQPDRSGVILKIILYVAA